MQHFIMVGAGEWPSAMIELFGREKDILFFYAKPRAPDETCMNRPVSLRWVKEFDVIDCISCVGDPRLSRTLIESIPGMPWWVNWIDPSPRIVKSARMGKGNIIQPHCTIRSESVLGSHITVCGYVNIAHHSKVGDHCFLGPKATFTGNTTLEEGVFFGAGAVIQPGLTIGEGSIIGAGSIVTKDIPANECWVGNPARKLKDLEPW